MLTSVFCSQRIPFLLVVSGNSIPFPIIQGTLIAAPSYSTAAETRFSGVHTPGIRHFTKALSFAIHRSKCSWKMKCPSACVLQHLSFLYGGLLSQIISFDSWLSYLKSARNSPFFDEHTSLYLSSLFSQGWTWNSGDLLKYCNKYHLHDTFPIPAIRTGNSYIYLF